MISIARTRIHCGRLMPPPPLSASAPPSSPTMRMKNVRKTSASVSSSWMNCFSNMNTTRVQRSVSGNNGRSERALRRRGQRWCRSSRISSSCYVVRSVNCLVKATISSITHLPYRRMRVR